MLPFVYLRLLLGSLLRALGYLLGKLPSAAWDEVVGGRSGARPAVAAGGRAGGGAGGSRRAASVSVRRLLPPWWAPYTNGLDSVLSRFSETVRSAGASLAASPAGGAAGAATRPRLESGPVPDEAIALPAGDGPLATMLRHPLLVLIGVLTLAGLVASRGLWGSGFLQGGALLPAPGGAADWWRLFAGGAVIRSGLGSDLTRRRTSPCSSLPGAAAVRQGVAGRRPGDAVRAGTRGPRGLVAPRAGWSAGSAARLWMSLAYGLVPVVTGAVSSGHLGTVVVAVLLPWVARSAAGSSTSTPAWPVGRGLGHRVSTLSVATAFAPAGWPIFVGLGGRRDRAGWPCDAQWQRVAQWLLAMALPGRAACPVVVACAHATRRCALTEAGVVVVPGAPSATRPGSWPSSGSARSAGRRGG